MTNWRMLGVLIAGVAAGSLGRWHGSIKLLGRPLASYRRRELARLVATVAQEPQMMLLDEPAAFLDLRHVAEILGQFRMLCVEQNLAIAATMHNLNAAASYADRVLLLNHGAAVACGPPDKVLTTANLEQVYRVKVDVTRNP